MVILVGVGAAAVAVVQQSPQGPVAQVGVVAAAAVEQRDGSSPLREPYIRTEL